MVNFFCSAQLLILAEWAEGNWVMSTLVHFKTRLPQYQSETGGHWLNVRTRADLPFQVPAGVSYQED